jgi:uncharacterized protein (TIGR02996 family)
MGVEDAFLHDILAHPDDDAPRLIYADWLDEHNDPRGEFIRIQCALAQLSDEDPRRWPLELREQELLREHEAKWLPNGIGEGPCVFRRGFVEEITLAPHDFFTRAEQVFEQIPLRYLCLRTVNRRVELERIAEASLIVGGVTFQRVAHSPRLAHLRGLRLAFALEAEELRSLQESPYLANLWELNLAHTGLTIENLRLLADSSSLPSLRELNLSGNRLTHAAAAVLAEGRLLSQLETLHLESNLLGDAGAVIVREWPALPRLTRLNLGHNQIFAAGAKALAEAPALRELISLNLSRNISCDEGAAALASSGWTRLQALNLWFNGVGDRGVRALAHAETLSQLTRLNLTANCVTDVGARALIESRSLPRSARLDLLRNDIGEAEQQRLRERFGPFVYC